MLRVKNCLYFDVELFLELVLLSHTMHITHAPIPCTAQLAHHPRPQSDPHPTYTEQDYMILLLLVTLYVT